MPDYRYAEYPSVKVLDDDGKEVNHLLFGDWVEVEGEDGAGWAKVRVRGTSGWIESSKLRRERVLEVVFTDVGQGDGCLVVTPQDKHIVVDAGVSDNMHRYLRWRYAGFKKKWTFQSAILTHPDADHYEGFRKLFDEQNVYFDAVYHNGIMEEFGTGAAELGPTTKDPDGRSYLTGLLRTQNDLKAFLKQTERWNISPAKTKQYPSLLDKALKSQRVGEIRMLGVATDEGPVYLPGYEAGSEVEIRVLAPLIEKDAAGAPRLRVFGKDPKAKSFDKGKTKNGHSVILMLRYGDVRLLFGGDLNSSSQAFLLRRYSGLAYEWPWTADAETEIVNAAIREFECDISKACHHGSDDVLDAYLRATNPAVTIISSGDEESHAHPRPDILGAVVLHSRGWRPLLFSTELMRSTREHEGSKAETVGRLREKLAREADPAKKKKIQEELDSVVDSLLERNVTVYGSINLRTDGQRTIMAYKLEKPRNSNGKLTKWDIYPLTRAGNGPLSFRPETE